MGCRVDAFFEAGQRIKEDGQRIKEVGQRIKEHGQRRVVFGVLGRRILRPRVAQETPRVANNDEKTAQRGPRGIPKEGKIAKPRKLQHLDFERPYEGLATFTPFGETGRRKKTAEI